MFKRLSPTSIADTLIPLLIALPIMVALLQPGLPNTADGPAHLIRSAEMWHAWQDGLPIPRWAANLGYGYGIPLFNYAPPLPYFSTALLRSTGLPMEVAFKGTWLLGLLISAFGAYRLTRDPMGVLPGAISAAAFIYAPLRLRELFIQGNLGQFIAGIFLPWACWGVIQLYQTGKRRYAAAIALSLAGTLLGHNAVALLLAIMLAGLVTTLFLFTRNIRATLWAIAGGLLGLALSAWFWLPALMERDYIHVENFLASNFRNRFVPPAELIALSPPLDTGAINPWFPLTLGAVQVWMALVGLIGLVVIIVRKRCAKHPAAQDLTPLIASGLFFALFTLFSGFMALAWSEPIWNTLPFIDLFQFPSRWHRATAVGLAWLCAPAIYVIGNRHKKLTWVAGGIGLLLLIGSALVNLYPQQLPPGTLKANSPADVVRFEVETGAVGTTSLSEFNPAWVTGDFTGSPLVADYQAGKPINRINLASLPEGATAATEQSSAQRYQLRLNLPQPATVTLNLFFFPGWTVEMDGALLLIGPHPESGLIDVPLPAGDHALTVTFRETPLRQLADGISIAAWGGLIVLGLARLVKRLQTPVAHGQASANYRPELIIVAAIVAASLIARFAFSDWFRVSSPPDKALPAEIPLRADFGDEIRLLGVDLPPIVVSPGESITAVAYWRVLQHTQTDYGVFLHLDAPGIVTVASVDERHPSEIPTSAWQSTLHLRNPLKLTVPTGALPIRYDLRVGLVNRQTGQALLLPDQNGSLKIGEVWVREASAIDVPSGGPHVRFGDSIHLLGIEHDSATQAITLYWQTDTPISQDYSIFLHLLNAENALIGQLDGTPYQNLYSTSAWRPGQVIEDTRLYGTVLDSGSPVDRIAVGIYNPATGQRLPATDPNGTPLPDDALIVIP